VRIFFDTNVLASALATRGFCHEVVDMALAEHDVVLGEPVLRELERVLAERFGVDRGRIDRALANLRRLPVQTNPGQLPGKLTTHLERISDPDDVPVVAAALAAEAELFVTGDRALREETAGLPLQVVSPRQLWELLRFERSPRAEEVHEPVTVRNDLP